MNKQKTFLANLVCTRISHDMVGNIGAIAAAIELATEDNHCVLDADARHILTSATDTLKTRQRFFRIAFGLDSVSTSPQELSRLCQDYLNTLGNRANKLDFECNNISPELAKIICLSLMIGAEICIKGGHIKIHIGGFLYQRRTFIHIFLYTETFIISIAQHKFCYYVIFLGRHLK